MEKSKFHIYAIGKVAKDSNDGDWEIDVFPAELFPTASGKLTEETKTTRTATDMNGNAVNVTNNTGHVLHCQWASMFDPYLFNPPRVFQGQAVLIWKYGGNTPEYYWTNFFTISAFKKDGSATTTRETNNEPGIRRTERRTIWLSNKSQILPSGQVDEVETGYYCDMDTINKLVKLHTSDNDGENTTYDFNINTKEGFLEIVDGYGNYIKLDSPQNHLTVVTNNELTINTKNKVTINTTEATVNCETSTVNAKASATIDTDQCTIKSSMCKINCG